MGVKKTKKSGRFSTKKKAEEAEFEFKRKLHDHINQNEITFEEMIELFLNFLSVEKVLRWRCIFEILVACIGKSLDNDFIEYNLDLLNNSDYKLDKVILHSDRGGMYKSGLYNTKTAEMHLVPSMPAPYTCTHNPWIETLNGQFKVFIKHNYPKNLDELQIVLKQFVYYNNNIKKIN